MIVVGVGEGGRNPRPSKISQKSRVSFGRGKKGENFYDSLSLSLIQDMWGWRRRGRRKKKMEK